MKLRELFNRQLNEATLRRGSRGDEVKALQRALGIRPADGIFGPQTEKAVRTFQTNAGLTVDGLAGGQTQAAVRRYAEEPDASSDFGNVRPGSDWSDLDPGDIEVTPAAEPETDTDAPDPDADDPRGDQTNPPPGMTRGTPLEIPDNPEDLLPPGADAEEPGTSGGPTTRPNNRPADPVSFDSIAAAMIGRDQVKVGDKVMIAGVEATVASTTDTDGGSKYYVDSNGDPLTATNDEEAKQATEEFVKAQVAELLRLRPTMPEGELIRKITKDAVEKGLNNDWVTRDAMATYIAGLVPTIDRAALRAAPDVTTDVGGGFGDGGGDSADNSGGGSSAADGGVDTTAPGGITTPEPDAAPDATATAAQQLSKFQQAYGQGVGADGLPSQFGQLFLGPVVNGDLASATAQKLSDELAGEIPAAPARVIAGRLENAHGNAAQMKQDADSIRDDSDPDLQDQVRALDILAPLLQKLKQAAERNESVELNRIKMLAGM
jgi:hypothetical protein